MPPSAYLSICEEGRRCCTIEERNSDLYSHTPSSVHFFVCNEGNDCGIIEEPDSDDSSQAEESHGRSEFQDASLYRCGNEENAEVLRSLSLRSVVSFLLYSSVLFEQSFVIPLRFRIIRRIVWPVRQLSTLSATPFPPVKENGVVFHVYSANHCRNKDSYMKQVLINAKAIKEKDRNVKVRV